MATTSLLLVEGKDKYAIENLLAYHNLQNLCELEEVGGVTNFLKFRALDFLLKAKKGSDKVGIILDADDKPADIRWGTLQTHLSRLNYQFPETKPSQKGTIVTQNTAVDLPSKVGIWVMPDNVSSGKLEDFLCKLIPNENNNQIWQLAKNCVEEASKLQIPKKFIAKDKVKAEVHTFLA
jgi:hypothetical protein